VNRIAVPVAIVVALAFVPRVAIDIPYVFGGGLNTPGSGIFIHPEDSSTANVEIVGNRILNIGQDPGIFATDHGDGVNLLSPVLNIKIENNTVALVNNGGTGGTFQGATGERW